MPTIPKIKADLIKDEKQLLIDLKKLQKGDLTNRKELLETLVPVINNSLVGTSKVLHFIAPNYAPIIDQRVLRGWGKFFQEEDYKNIPKLPSPKVSLNKKHIDQYMAYWDCMNQWVANCKDEEISLRTIEEKFFLLGKKEPSKEVSKK